MSIKLKSIVEKEQHDYAPYAQFDKIKNLVSKTVQAVVMDNRYIFS